MVASASSLTAVSGPLIFSFYLCSWRTWIYKVTSSIQKEFDEVIICTFVTKISSLFFQELGAERNTIPLLFLIAKYFIRFSGSSGGKGHTVTFGVNNERAESIVLFYHMTCWLWSRGMIYCWDHFYSSTGKFLCAILWCMKLLSPLTITYF